MQLHDWVTSAIAAIALLLSMLNAASGWLKQRPKVRVTVEWPYEDALPQDERNRRAIVKAVNLSQRTIHLSSVAGFILPNKTIIPINGSKGKSIEFEEPYDYDLGAPHLVGFLQKEGFTGKVKMTPFCKDHRGRKYKGRAVAFDMAQWQKLSEMDNRPRPQYRPKSFQEQQEQTKQAS